MQEVAPLDTQMPSDRGAPPVRGSRRVVVVAVLLALGLGGGAYWLWGRSGGHDYPARWDPRIAPIAAEVAKLRRLEFKHPVAVDFLSPAKFRSSVTVQGKDLSASDRSKIRRTEGLLRALGLVRGNVDLLGSANQLRGADVLALYDPGTKRVRVRGESLDVAARVTVAHELTHALQDQYFDLTKIRRAAAHDKTQTAVTALIEGDAVSTEKAYYDQLPAADRDAYNKAEQAVSGALKGDTRDVPPFIVAAQAAPYALGRPMVETIKVLHGERGVDDAFRDPPLSDLDFLAPLVADRHPSPVKVPTPPLRPGERRDDSDVFGPFDLYVTLAGRLPQAEALRIGDGWGGDSMLEFHRRDATCMRVAFVGRDAGSTQAILDGWRRWQAAMPVGASQVETVAGRVVVTACDGQGAAPAPTSAVDALGFAATRNVLGASLARSVAPGVALCAANGTMADPTLLARLESGQPADTSSRQRILGIVRACPQSS